MSFVELEVENIPVDGAYLRGADQGHRRIVMAMERLDKSWELNFRMTSSVLCVMAADIAEDRPDHVVEVVDMVEGLMMLKKSLSDAWSQAYGSITVGPIDQKALAETAKHVEKASAALALKMDRFGRMILGELVCDLPAMWVAYYRQMAETCGAVSRELEGEDGEFAAKIVVDEQQKLTNALVEFVTEAVAVVPDGSEQPVAMKRASRWVKAARQTYLEALGRGAGEMDAMAKVVQGHGFPDVSKEI